MDVAVGEELQGTTEPHSTTVRGMAVSPDGAVLATVAGGDQVKLWDISHGASLGSLTVDGRELLRRSSSTA